MRFLAFRNADVKFYARKLNLRKYNIVKTMPTAKQVKQINKHKFVQVSLDKASKMFIISVAALKRPMSIMTIYPTRKSWLAILKQNKAPIEVLIK